MSTGERPGEGEPTMQTNANADDRAVATALDGVIVRGA
jgi:hypothetical protein